LLIAPSYFEEAFLLDKRVVLQEKPPHALH
jgi:hypothetical protein